ncbi:MAG TPA: sigma-70 family RNA polymerase sigma factor [Tepidisphaeraceae bacterium]|nr:sigma-70 family RNA polymerase sigma factor [Tepidisphaeraceae bacterium]
MKLSAEQFEKLALDQLDTLYRVASRLTRNSDQASDLVQETYLRAFRSKDSFDLQEHGIRPWLLRIMRNLHLSRADREKRQPVAMEGDALDALNVGPAGGVAPGPAEAEGTRAPPDTVERIHLDWENLDERLKQALEALQEEYQIVLLLWAVEDLSYKEIAEVLDVPIGTVMSRLHRARQKLTAQLREYALKEGMIRE